MDSYAQQGHGRKVIKIGLLGYGRTGKIVSEYLDKRKDVSLKFVIKNTPIKHPHMNIYTHFDLGRCIENSRPDVLIDFTTKEATIANLAVLAEVGFKKGIVIATTGFTANEMDVIKDYKKKFSIIWCPNISSGINLLIMAAKLISEVWWDSDVHIIEEHFKAKKDISGSAQRIRDSLEKGDIIAIRSGGTIGIHKVIFGRENQKIEITHQSHSRFVFAAGALRVARWLTGVKRDFYIMEDYINSQFNLNKREINEE